MARIDVFIKNRRDSGERFSASVKIPPNSKSIVIDIDSDNIDWNTAGVNVKLQTQISQNGVTWRNYHGMGIDTSKKIPSDRPRLYFDVDNLVGWFIRVRLVNNKTMNIGVGIEVT